MFVSSGKPPWHGDQQSKPRLMNMLCDIIPWVAPNHVRRIWRMRKSSSVEQSSSGMVWNKMFVLLHFASLWSVIYFAGYHKKHGISSSGWPHSRIFVHRNLCAHCESKWSIGSVLQPKHNTKRQRMSCGLPVWNWTGVALKGVLHQGDWCSKRAEVPLACRGKEGRLE